MTIEFNNRFNTRFTKSAIWHKLNRIFDNQIVRKTNRILPRVVWTREMINYIITNLNNCSYNSLAKEMSAKFNCYITASSLEHKASRVGLKKDLSMIKNYARPNMGRFKKGKASSRRKPIGFERKDSEGNIWIKYAHPDKFMRKARWIYIQHYGKIPKGYNVIQLNGNKLDFRIENLKALSNADLALFNKANIDPKGNDNIAVIKMDVVSIYKNRKEKKNASKK